jgi:hypothetical protein
MGSLQSTLPIKRYIEIGGYVGRILRHNCLIVTKIKDCQNRKLAQRSSNTKKYFYRDISRETVQLWTDATLVINHVAKDYCFKISDVILLILSLETSLYFNLFEYTHSLNYGTVLLLKCSAIPKEMSVLLENIPLWLFFFLILI